MIDVNSAIPVCDSARERWPVTLSVLLPTHNRPWTLGRQIDSILPQLGPLDELIVFANGCDSRTSWVMDYFDDPRIIEEHSLRPAGVCGAYNWCAAKAKNDWVLGCNDHNWLFAEAIQSWRQFALKFPDARVMHGRIDAMPRMGWLAGGGYIHPTAIPLLVNAKQWITHGAETFIRRDSWGAGYREELEWMADQEQSLTLAFRHGVIDVPAMISHVDFAPGNYSQAHGVKERFNRVIRAWRALVDTEEFEDVKEQYLLLHKLTGHFNERI